MQNLNYFHTNLIHTHTQELLMCFKKFCKADGSLEDEECSGHPSEGDHGLIAKRHPGTTHLCGTGNTELSGISYSARGHSADLEDSILQAIVPR